MFPLSCQSLCQWKRNPLTEHLCGGKIRLCLSQSLIDMWVCLNLFRKEKYLSICPGESEIYLVLLSAVVPVSAYILGGQFQCISHFTESNCYFFSDKFLYVIGILNYSEFIGLRMNGD